MKILIVKYINAYPNHKYLLQTNKQTNKQTNNPFYHFNRRITLTKLPAGASKGCSERDKGCSKWYKGYSEGYKGCSKQRIKRICNPQIQFQIPLIAQKSDTFNKPSTSPERLVSIENKLQNIEEDMLQLITVGATERRTGKLNN